jgi:hypothetical protein
VPDLEDLWSQIELVGKGAMTLMAVAVVLTVWLRTKAFAPTVAAMVLGAVALWAINNPYVFRQMVDAETEADVSNPSPPVCTPQAQHQGHC